MLVREPVSRRAYEFVSIHTDAGVTGLGEARPIGMAGSSAGALLDAHLVGQDARSAQAVAQHLKTALDDRHAHLAAAVNMALLDIMGKLSRAPIHKVLGGPTRTKARAL
ncbi:MAG: hypothetical protein IH851_14040, partial [Armatimonadetes bacterium]|nr:hypothetical protein [Armatimonadota bacterium]